MKYSEFIKKYQPFIPVGWFIMMIGIFIGSYFVLSLGLMFMGTQHLMEWLINVIGL